MKGKPVRSMTTKKTVAMVACAVFLIASTVFVLVHRIQNTPLRTTVLVVGETSIEMNYFLKRAAQSRREPMAMLQTLINESLIRQIAPRHPYNISVTDNDVDLFLMELARGKIGSIDENEFREWYRQQVNESRLSDSEFREIVEANLLAQRLTEYLAERVPTVAEQVHLHKIVVQGETATRSVISRLKAGEDFAAIAREVSIRERAEETGGVIGWVPRRAITSQFARVAFDELAIGEVSEPIHVGEGTVAILMVSERATAREINDESRGRIQATVLDEWLRQQQYDRQSVSLHGFNNGYDSETDAWVRRQIQRMRN